MRPGRFIPIAEQSSLILDIGAWVIEEVCAQLARWRAQGLHMPQVAVNVGARQFSSGHLQSQGCDALQAFGLARPMPLAEFEALGARGAPG